MKHNCFCIRSCMELNPAPSPTHLLGVDTQSTAWQPAAEPQCSWVRVWNTPSAHVMLCYTEKRTY